MELLNQISYILFEILYIPMYMYINILLMLYQTFLFFVGQQDHERNLRNQFVHKLSHVVYLQNIEQIYRSLYYNRKILPLHFQQNLRYLLMHLQNNHENKNPILQYYHNFSKVPIDFPSHSYYQFLLLLYYLLIHPILLILRL